MLNIAWILISRRFIQHDLRAAAHGPYALISSKQKKLFQLLGTACASAMSGEPLLLASYKAWNALLACMLSHMISMQVEAAWIKARLPYTRLLHIITPLSIGTLACPAIPMMPC